MCVFFKMINLSGDFESEATRVYLTLGSVAFYKALPTVKAEKD